MLLRSGLLLSLALLINGQSIDQRDRDFWNAKFSDLNTRFSREPSPLLAEAIRDRSPGRALDLGMGEGRNTLYLYLAQQGWHTTGVDLSDVGISKARRRASELRLNITTVVDSADHYELGVGKWDVIAMFYMHAWYHSAKPANIKRLVAALNPGGRLVIEGFAGPENFMFQSNELLRDFAMLRVLRYEDAKTEAEWAPGRQSRVIRFIAEKAD